MISTNGASGISFYSIFDATLIIVLINLCISHYIQINDMPFSCQSEIEQREHLNDTTIMEINNFVARQKTKNKLNILHLCMRVIAKSCQEF